MGEHTASYAGLIDLGHAMQAGWVGFYYQPKIDLRLRQVVGIELFARAHHPFHGLLPASLLLSGAEDKYLAKLTAHAFRSAHALSGCLNGAGSRPSITINVPGMILTRFPVKTVFGSWNADPNGTLILDLIEDDVLSAADRLVACASDLATLGIRLAVDNFGHALFSIRPSDTDFETEFARVHSRLLALKTAGFAELKLDRGMVEGCSVDPRRAAMCKTTIDLIHHLGGTAVAIGITKHVDALALAEMGCDVGQGHLFSEPLPEHELLELLQRKTWHESLRAPTARTA